MIYADFDYYKNEYFGTDIEDEKEFKRLALKASAYINALTAGRVEMPAPEMVKNAMCAVVDVDKLYADGEGGVASETIGPMSKTYANVEEKTIEKERYQAAYPFLSGTGLLYRGIQ